MTTPSPKIGLFTRLKLLWFQLLRSILHLWVKARILPEPFSDLELDPEQPICYVIDSYELTTLLILDKACEELGLPRPLWPLSMASGVEPRSYLALRRKKGLIIRRTEVERIENRRYRELAAAGSRPADDPGSLQPLPAV